MRIFLTLAACVVVISCSKSVEQADGKNESVEPLYKQALSQLQQSDSVIPPKLDVHPASALFNREAIIPPQCYTQTEGKYNPCYVCHQNEMPDRENVMNDAELQEAYSFSDVGMTNHWLGLFEDRRERIAQMSDEYILDWIDDDNYSELAPRLREAGFKGWIPDLGNLELGKDAFDNNGFAKDGSHWVAFNYKPFPSTFWPTNGSTDDVMIRLPDVFRSSPDGKYSADIYKANLAIVEAKLKGMDNIGSLPIDESEVGKDLNRDGALSVIDRITDVSAYVGAAAEYFIDTFLYPEGTEFLHTVRYLGFDKDQNITVSKRMKEVRYMKKWRAYPKGALSRYYEEEGYQKEAGHLPGYTNLGDYGLDNGMGWSVQGFIENKNGRLRANTYEENFFCMGCHASVGSTIDKTFSFARKVDGAKGWAYINLHDMPDVPNKGESKGEFLTYFERAGGGDEFRSNQEMRQKWFHQDGTVNSDAIKSEDVFDLITPSRSRALALNKAYRAIVEQQSYLFGRDSVVAPPQNVYKEVSNQKAPTLDEDKIYDWDIRLAWPE